MDIKDFSLTQEDFELIMKALEYLPESGAVGELMETMLGTLLPDDRNYRSKYEALKKAKDRSREAKRAALVEEVRILQGKLLTIKRELMQAGALKQASDILKPNI